MSNSRRKTPVFGNAGATSRQSEKQNKRLANRALRRLVNEELEKVKDCPELADSQELPEMREVSDVWGFDKDGKRYWNPDATLEEHNEKHWRSNQTDVTLHKKMMRK